MKKRLLSWLLVLTMVISLIPSTLVTTAFAADNTSVQASGQAGKTVELVDNKWPGSLNSDITDVTITSTVTPGTTLYVRSGKTLIFHGNGYLAGASAGIPLVVVEDGGQLVLDDLIIRNNQVGVNGAIYVKKGGLLDLGYNDQKERRAPSVTNNTYNGAAKNIVIADDARVRLNNAATKKIGISYDGTVAAPVPLLEGGRYALTNDDLQYVVADDSKLGMLRWVITPTTCRSTSRPALLLLLRTTRRCLKHSVRLETTSIQLCCVTPTLPRSATNFSLRSPR